MGQGRGGGLNSLDSPPPSYTPSIHTNIKTNTIEIVERKFAMSGVFKMETINAWVVYPLKVYRQVERNWNISRVRFVSYRFWPTVVSDPVNNIYRANYKVLFTLRSYVYYPPSQMINVIYWCYIPSTIFV